MSAWQAMKTSDARFGLSGGGNVGHWGRIILYMPGQRVTFSLIASSVSFFDSIQCPLYTQLKYSFCLTEPRQECLSIWNIPQKSND